MGLLSDIHPGKDELEKITRLAALLTPPEQIALRIGYNEEIFSTCLTIPGHDIRNAYIAGLTETEEKLRSAAIDAATAGSPAAMEQCMTFLKNAKHKL